jgi:uncharacterized small protein (DUF1192 family)
LNSAFHVGPVSELASRLQYLVPEAAMKEAKDDKKDRRRSKRLEVNGGITGRIKPTMEVRIVNISQHGMLIESPCGLPPAGMCELTVEGPSGPRVIRAKVARCRAQMVKKDDGSVVIRFHAGLEFPEDLAEGLVVQKIMSEICTLEVPVDEVAAGATAIGIEQAM